MSLLDTIMTALVVFFLVPCLSFMLHHYLMCLLDYNKPNKIRIIIVDMGLIWVTVAAIAHFTLKYQGNNYGDSVVFMWFMIIGLALIAIGLSFGLLINIVDRSSKRKRAC